MSEPTDKPIVITININPLKGGKRTLVISGAPQDEMPELRTGTFPQLHALLDDVWIALNKRKPQVVSKPKASVETKKGKDETDEEETASSAETDAETDEAAKQHADAAAEFEAAVSGDPGHAQPDQLVRPDSLADVATPEEALPIIKGDPTL